MSRSGKITRDQLLKLADEKPDESLQFKGHLKWNDTSEWFTFSTIILLSSNERIASHINLPKHKINKLLDINESDNHKLFIIEGYPSFYMSRGTRRGSIKMKNIKKF
jgi:hypothetical protein